MMLKLTNPLIDFAQSRDHFNSTMMLSNGALYHKIYQVQHLGNPLFSQETHGDKIPESQCKFCSLFSQTGKIFSAATELREVLQTVSTFS
jgi:hypothetical protein